MIRNVKLAERNLVLRRIQVTLVVVLFVLGSVLVLKASVWCLNNK